MSEPIQLSKVILFVGNRDAHPSSVTSLCRQVYPTRSEIIAWPELTEVDFTAYFFHEYENGKDSTKVKKEGFQVFDINGYLILEVEATHMGASAQYQKLAEEIAKKFPREETILVHVHN